MIRNIPAVLFDKHIKNSKIVSYAVGSGVVPILQTEDVLKGRDGVVIQNTHTTNIVSISPNNTVTPNSGIDPGYELGKRDAIDIPLPDDSMWYMISDTLDSIPDSVVIVFQYQLEK